MKDVYRLAIERKDEEANIPLSEVMKQLNIDPQEIMKIVDTIEED